MRRVIDTPKAYRSKSPLAQAIVEGNLIFVSGMPPVDPQGRTVEGDVTSQTRGVMDNLKTILEEAGASMDRVVRTTLFYTHREDYAAIDAVYREYFGTTVPSRSAVIIAGLVRPEWRIEIDAIAALPSPGGHGSNA